MIAIEMTVQEWQQVLGILAGAPWRDANPLMMKIGAQMQQAQQRPDPSAPYPPVPPRPSGNGSKETSP